MKKTIVTLATLATAAFMLSACGSSQPVQNAATETAAATPAAEASSPSEPGNGSLTLPTEGYALGMSRTDINSKLGNPSDKDGNHDSYYHVDFLGMDGHLDFAYSDGAVNAVSWVSPAANYTESERSNVVDSVKRVYDSAYGDSEFIDWGNGVEYYSWNDSFNKTDALLAIISGDGGIHFEFGISKQVDLPDIDASADELQSVLDAIAAEMDPEN